MSRDALNPFDLSPGRTVAERFRIESAQRHGGFAATFRAHDEKLGIDCELVVFPATLFETRAQVEDYRKSLEPWLSVRSERVARLHELLIPDGQTLLAVCELPPGRSLREWIGLHGSLAAPRAVEFGQALLEGLRAIHQADLVHGDIKPQTIFVEDAAGQPSNPKLVDGGVTAGLWSAKHLGDRTALIGTPFYAPIEQFGGESPDVQSDIYNVATVLYELLTGVLPWKGKSLLEIFQQKLERTPPSMRVRAPGIVIDAELERTVTRGLLAERKERYSDVRQFQDALSALRVR